MATQDTPFPELLKQARAGDRAALEHLAQTYEKDVRIAARVLLGPALRTHLDSVDLVQTVHKSLMLGMQNGKFDINCPAQLVALAMTLVRRKVARKWRVHRRQVHSQSPSSTREDLGAILASLRSTEVDPATAALTREAETKLLRNLPAEDRQLLELRLRGFTTAEAARKMGQNPDIMRVRLSRLRKELQDIGAMHDWL
jgi:RNA polymerase sigma factor (sigma-70 family)